MLINAFDGTASRRIDASPAEVFEFITAVATLPEWNAHIHHVIERPLEPLAEGDEWVVQMRVLGVRWRSRSHALVVDPVDGRFEHTSRTDDDNPSLAVWSWHVTPCGDGGSLLSVGWVGRPKTFGRQLLAARMRRTQLRNEVAASLETLATRFHASAVAARHVRS
ncbi:MAG TPA: SRPBCC family protein [Jatrophihabitantaceae bacterium]|nr:SRPBCC family protein [Jatrophihabitantaceae bacterium]